MGTQSPAFHNSSLRSSGNSGNFPEPVRRAPSLRFKSPEFREAVRISKVLQLLCRFPLTFPNLNAVAKAIQAESAFCSVSLGQAASDICAASQRAAEKGYCLDYFFFADATWRYFPEPAAPLPPILCSNCGDTRLLRVVWSLSKRARAEGELTPCPDCAGDCI
jgi:hypothetical protein